MSSVEKETYKSMLAKLASNNVLTPCLADQMGPVVDHKKHGYKVKRYIAELLSLLTLFDTINEPPPPPKEKKPKPSKDLKQ